MVKNKTRLASSAKDCKSKSVVVKYDARNPDSLKKLISEGAKVKPFSKEILDASFDASQELFAELNESNPEWKKIYADYREFQKNELLWFRLAEARFDQYIQSKRL